MIFKCYYNVVGGKYGNVYTRYFSVESLDEMKEWFESRDYQLIYAKEIVSDEDIEEFRNKMLKY